MVHLLSPPTVRPGSFHNAVLANVRKVLREGELEGDFRVIPDVPIFPEHQTRAGDGRWLVFDYAALKAVCNACNRRIASTGDYAAITIGHTPDPALVRVGKAIAPPIVGFAGPFRMGLLGEPGYQKWCILARFRIYADEWATVRRYPRRSPELWLMRTYDQMFLDPIALLGAETPRLDMGLLYSATSQALVSAPPASELGRVLYRAALQSGGADCPTLIEKYAAVAPAAGNVFAPSEKYQGESAMDADAIVQAVVAALDSLDWVQWVKSRMQAEAAPAALGSAPPPDVTAPPPPAAPPAGNPAAPPAAGGDSVTAPPAMPAAGPPATAPPGPATPPAADDAPPVEERSETDPEKNAAVSASPAVPRVKYDASGAPEGILVDDDDDDDDLEPEAGESVEQYRARSREHRKRRRKSHMNYSLDASGAEALRSVVTEVVAPLAKQVQELQSAQEKASTGTKNVERYQRLESLHRQGYAIDPDELMTKMRYSATGDAGISDEEFERSFELLKKTGNRAPLDAPLMPIPQSIEHYSAQPGDGNAATSDQRNTARDLCEKAVTAGKSADYVATLRNVVAGKNEVAISP